MGDEVIAQIVVLVLMLVGLLMACWVFRLRACGLGGRHEPTEWPASYPTASSWREANRRAEALLAEFLTAEQVQAVKKTGYLTVPSPGHPGRVYYIPSRLGYVMVYEDGQQAFRLCVQSCEHLPEADRVLQHKLMIEGNEDRYLAVAHWLPLL
ncbi:MAG: hypothetical protein HYY20_10595 [Candidatus Tectomicrobia bacterium]|uniref:Uncharacterized protein n=1 Tax=Tectimicrobiota bacterium TaxID=2528274 RepID=A0A932FZB8_UNCTE|nr:hypothetical protein [Candidatus Tectomicrobia bacterium]